MFYIQIPQSLKCLQMFMTPLHIFFNGRLINRPIDRQWHKCIDRLVEKSYWNFTSVNTIWAILNKEPDINILKRINSNNQKHI